MEEVKCPKSRKLRVEYLNQARVFVGTEQHHDALEYQDGEQLIFKAKVDEAIKKLHEE